MKIFRARHGYSEKLNFVDDNNVLVGFDDEDCCYETWGWYINETAAPSDADDGDVNADYTGWNFDPAFFERFEDLNRFDEGGCAVFRLVKEDKELFLHLYNCHSGYYSHGFEMSVGGLTIQEGSI